MAASWTCWTLSAPNGPPVPRGIPSANLASRSDIYIRIVLVKTVVVRCGRSHGALPSERLNAP
jgi:hypothetical protein